MNRVVARRLVCELVLHAFGADREAREDTHWPTLMRLLTHDDELGRLCKRALAIATRSAD